jgi:hypothetical protein
VPIYNAPLDGGGRADGRVPEGQPTPAGDDASQEPPADGGASSPGADAARDGGRGSPGHVVYTVGDRIFRIDAQPGAAPFDMSAKLTSSSAGAIDRRVDVSHAGNWLTFVTDRFDPECADLCLAVAPTDLASAEAVRAAGAFVHPEGISAIASNGQVLVTPLRSAPHPVDLFVLRRTVGGWSAPVNITQGSARPFNNMPALSHNDLTVLFDCGASPYPESGDSAVCEVAVDGTGLREVVTHRALPGARNDYVQNAHYAPSGIVFEGSWPTAGLTPPPETVWRLRPSGQIDVVGASVLKSYSPCALPDGRVAVLWVGRAGNPQQAREVTLLDATFSVVATLTPGVDVADVGIGCGY